MRFFNQKEEVINIELTSYGREKFSKGEFEPVFYSFYDSDILYDGEYGKITERQNQITNRIANETPRLKINPRYTSDPSSIFSLSSANTRDTFYQENSWNAPYYRVLGNNDPNSEYYPSWKIIVPSFGAVGLNPGVEYLSGRTIPQMSATLHLDYTLRRNREEDAGIYVLDENQSLILSIEELNTVFKGNGNFDIEVFVSSSDEVRSIQFINDEFSGAELISEQQDPLTLLESIEGTNSRIIENFPVLDQTYTEYFLDITVDREIFSELGTASPSGMYQSTTVTDPESPCADVITED
tara:strand:+ start:16323 stop:17213 length:891 start_codon:yes stop_codon:yes gene_type:complete